MTTPAFPHAAAIEASLEMVAERCADPTPLVYERLFAVEPELRPYFWRDSNGSIKGEMLSKVFDAILDFIGERQYAHQLIMTEMVNHEGFDVPREIFATFFATVASAVREVLGDDWTPQIETAWTELIADIQAYVTGVPRSDVVTPAFPSYYQRKAAASA